MLCFYNRYLQYIGLKTQIIVIMYYLIFQTQNFLHQFSQFDHVLVLRNTRNKQGRNMSSRRTHLEMWRVDPNMLLANQIEAMTSQAEWTEQQKSEHARAKVLKPSWLLINVRNSWLVCEHTALFLFVRRLLAERLHNKIELDYANKLNAS